MTILAACRGAAPYIGLAVPTSVFGSSEREHLELAEIANEAAADIMEAHDWQGLKVLQTYTGDGAAADFALPADFLRMPKDQRVWSSAQETPMTHVLSHDDWLELDVKSYELVIRAWTFLGGRFAVKPTMPTTETAKFYYQSNLYAQNAGGENRASFTMDSDVFRLPERLVKLDIVWRWKAAKGMDYAEDMANAEMARAKSIAADKGPRTLAIGRGAYPRGVTIAYPQAIRP